MDSESLMEQIAVLDWESRHSHGKVLESIHINLRGGDPQPPNNGYQLPDLYMLLLHDEAGKGGGGLPLNLAPPYLKS